MKTISNLLNILYEMSECLSYVTSRLKPNVLMPPVEYVNTFLDRMMDSIIENNPLMKMD